MRSQDLESKKDTARPGWSIDQEGKTSETDTVYWKLQGVSLLSLF